ncbi:MAG: SRPBCC family protein [Ferrimicrobium sp.]
MSILIISAQAMSSASPQTFFDRWADMATWPEWNSDIEWARLEGTFAEGSLGVIKPKKGPKTKFVIQQLDLGRAYVDVSRLPGARLTFSHLVSDRVEGGCTIDVAITLDGPLARIWNLILAKGFRATTQVDLDRLVEVVELVK